MANDPYAVLQALLRAEGVRNAPKPKAEPRPAPAEQREETPPPKEQARD